MPLCSLKQLPSPYQSQRAAKGAAEGHSASPKLLGKPLCTRDISQGPIPFSLHHWSSKKGVQGRERRTESGRRVLHNINLFLQKSHKQPQDPMTNSITAVGTVNTLIFKDRTKCFYYINKCKTIHSVAYCSLNTEMISVSSDVNLTCSTNTKHAQIKLKSALKVYIVPLL